MTPINTIDGAVDFLRAHDCRRDAIAGLWVAHDGTLLESCPIESAEQLRRALHRADISSGKKRWLDGGKIGL